MSVVKALSELVSIPSSYPNEEKIGRYIEKMLKEMGFKVNLQKVGDKRFNILAEKGKGPALLIFGHLDTVEKKEGWRTNPYRLTENGDKLYGLGAWDMKAGVAAALSSAKDFTNKNRAIKLAFVVDEEFVSLGMHTLIESGWLNNVVGAVCPEPGFDYGIKGIAIGRVGRPVFKINVKTKGGHVYLARSRPNAIEEANKVLGIIKKIKPIHHKDLGNSYLFPRSISAKDLSMGIPDFVEMEVEGQTVPLQTSQSVLQELKNIVNEETKKGKIRAEVFIALLERPTPFCEPFAISKRNSFVQFVKANLEATIKDKPVLYYRRSVGDENRVASLGIPVITVGPEGGNAHEANEWVSKKSLLTLEPFFKRLLSN